MRAVIDRSGLERRAASTSQMGRFFETVWLTRDTDLMAPAELPAVAKPMIDPHEMFEATDMILTSLLGGTAKP
jgi:hypothetical protein